MPPSLRRRASLRGSSLWHGPGEAALVLLDLGRAGEHDGGSVAAGDDAGVSLDVEVLAVADDGVPSHLEDLAAELPTNGAVEHVQEALPDLVGRPSLANLGDERVVGIGSHREFFDEAQHVRDDHARVLREDGLREELNAGGGRAEGIHVADEVQLHREGQLAANAAKSVVNRKEARDGVRVVVALAAIARKLRNVGIGCRGFRGGTGEIKSRRDGEDRAK